jgi:hypothetical protein
MYPHEPVRKPISILTLVPTRPSANLRQSEIMYPHEPVRKPVVILTLEVLQS